MTKTGFLAVLSACLLCAPGASAQWPTSPAERLYIGNGGLASIASDGEGGAFVVYWHSYGNESNCYFQHLDGEGYQQFPYPIHLDTGVGTTVWEFDVVTDGCGGAIFGVLEVSFEDTNWYGRLALFRYNNEGQNIYYETVAKVPGVIASEAKVSPNSLFN